MELKKVEIITDCTVICFSATDGILAKENLHWLVVETFKEGRNVKREFYNSARKPSRDVHSLLQTDYIAETIRIENPDMVIVEVEGKPEKTQIFMRSEIMHYQMPDIHQL